MISLKSASLEATNFFNSASSSETGSGSSIVNTTKLGEIEVNFEGSTLIGSTVITITGSSPGQTREETVGE